MIASPISDIFRPLGDKVLVLPNTPPEKTESGIYLPESLNLVPVEGKVIGIGPKVKEVLPDDVVRFRIDHKTTKIFQFNGATHYLVRERDIDGSAGN